MRREHLRLDYQSIERQAIILTIHHVSPENCILHDFSGAGTVGVRTQWQGRREHHKLMPKLTRNGGVTGHAMGENAEPELIYRAQKVKSWRGDLETSYFEGVVLPSRWGQCSSKNI